MKEFIDWLASSKSGIIRMKHAEEKARELGIPLTSLELYDAITDAGYYMVAGSSDLIVRGGETESE